MDETILLIFELKNCPIVFDKLQRSNFCILGLRTARLHSKTAAQIFDEKIQGMTDQINFEHRTLKTAEIICPIKLKILVRLKSSVNCYIAL